MHANDERRSATTCTRGVGRCSRAGIPIRPLCCCRRAKLLEPEKASIREALGRASARAGRASRARREFAKAVSSTRPTTTPTSALALACERTGQRSRARDTRSSLSSFGRTCRTTSRCSSDCRLELCSSIRMTRSCSISTAFCTGGLNRSGRRRHGRGPPRTGSGSPSSRTAPAGRCTGRGAARVGRRAPSRGGRDVGTRHGRGAERARRAVRVRGRWGGPGRRAWPKGSGRGRTGRGCRRRCRGVRSRRHYAKLKDASVLVARGVPLIASNADASFLPRAGRRGQVPAPSSPRSRRQPARRPRLIGKPEAPLLVLALDAAGGGRPLVVGDHLDTDIAGAARLGWDSVLVLTGSQTGGRGASRLGSPRSSWTAWPTW